MESDSLSSKTRHFDYIILGAGAAGLMLADAMGAEPFFQNKSILLIDKNLKQTNDRTWCFWEIGEGHFDHLVHASWTALYFGGMAFKKRMDIAPYTYKMIRGIDFYTDCLHRINGYGNITFHHGAVDRIEEWEDHVNITTSRTTFTASRVFNSIFEYKTITSQQKYPALQQHFIGWFIKTKTPVFDTTVATFMDFSIPQKGNTRFMYVLPFTEKEALVEYTLFSAQRLPDTEYEEAIVEYIRGLPGGPAYEILNREKGSIPMSCYDFELHNTASVLHIGTAGGWAKPSTGFTFRNTAKKTGKLLQHLKENRPLSAFSAKNRFRFYDLLLLDILHRSNEKGSLIFEAMFRKRPPQLILKFLDEETTLWEDLRIILACPKREFIMAFLRRLF